MPFKKPTMQPDSRHLPTSSTESMRIQIMNRISTRQHVKKEILQKSLDETNFFAWKTVPSLIYYMKKQQDCFFYQRS